MRTGRPVGLGYMPKGGRAAAAAHNAAWSARPSAAPVDPLTLDERSDVRVSARSDGRPLARIVVASLAVVGCTAGVVQWWPWSIVRLVAPW